MSAAVSALRGEAVPSRSQVKSLLEVLFMQSERKLIVDFAADIKAQETMCALALIKDLIAYGGSLE